MMKKGTGYMYPDTQYHKNIVIHIFVKNSRRILKMHFILQKQM